MCVRCLFTRAKSLIYDQSSANSHSHLFPGVAVLAENICRTVAERMVAINGENSSKNERRGANVLVMDDVWDHAGRNHHSELLDLDRQALLLN